MSRRILYLTLGVALLACGAMAHRSRRRAARFTDVSISDTRPEILGGAVHECYRECVEGDNRVCKYEFNVVEYSSMGAACSDCPYNATDCYKRGCITAGGEPREVRVVNYMLPGPSVQVCRGDTIRVELYNEFVSDTVVIHWHGMYQKDTPYMDGVSFVTQCPILPGNLFIYSFMADPAGTHLWHSHSGLQEPDGFFGSVVVREPEDPLAKYYDRDLAEHVIMIWHWFGAPTNSITTSKFFRSDIALGYSLIINGYNSARSYTKNGKTYVTPRAKFTVKRGLRYRFRVIGNTAIYCPLQLSVDHHKLLVIATDGGPVEPVMVDSFIINAGERYDFVLTADRDVRNYWMKVRGLGNCAANQTYSAAIMHYQGATNAEPSETITYADTDRAGVLLNPVGKIDPFPKNTEITVADLKCTSENADDVSGEPDHIFYWTLGLYSYGEYGVPALYAQMGDMSFDYPTIPLLTQYDEVTEDMWCDQTNKTYAECENGYCNCPTIYSADLNSLVEIVVYDDTTIAAVDHPLHMHGGHFRVVYMERGDGSMTLDDVKARNENGAIPKTFDTAPLKDVVGVPSRGFAVLRFRAHNPGYWLVHCHIALHAEEGMATLLKVGKDSDMIHPEAGFPRCGDYNPDSNSNHYGQTCTPVRPDQTPGAPTRRTTTTTIKTTTRAMPQVTRTAIANDRDSDSDSAEWPMAVRHFSDAKARRAAAAAEREKRREIVKGAKAALKALKEKHRHW